MARKSETSEIEDLDRVPWGPTWRYGPGGAAAIFTDPNDVPAGWKDHPSKVEETPIEDL